MRLWFPVLFCNIHRGWPGWREGPTSAPRSASHCSGWSFSRCLHLCLLCALDVLAVPAAALAHSHTAVTAPPFPRAFLFFSIDMRFFCLFCFFCCFLKGVHTGLVLRSIFHLTLSPVEIMHYSILFPHFRGVPSGCCKLKETADESSDPLH